MPCAEGGPESSSLKTEEKTKLIVSNRTEDESYDVRCSRPTHQCTNWELVRTGPDGCRPTIEQ